MVIKTEHHEFETLWQAHKPAIQRFVYFKMPAKQDGDDILQEIALAAFKSISALTNPAVFKPWVLKIAVNKCNDFYRRLAKHESIPIDEITENVLSKNLAGISIESKVKEAVHDTLAELGNNDKQILYLYYFKAMPQAEIAQILNIPLGTVKSRLHTAKRNFKQAYPFAPPQKQGEITMKKQLPEIMPQYKITASSGTPFNVKWEENLGWFIVPRLGETCTWAMYDQPSGNRTEVCEMEVIGKAQVHGIEGVEIVAVETNPHIQNQVNGNAPVERRFVAQLTDTHSRLLAESHTENGIKKFHTFLDADEFIPNWGFGENNCGHETNLVPKGIITKQGNAITCPPNKQVMDVVGRYNIEMNGKTYDTILLVDVELYNTGTLAEHYIDQNGRTVLWRRFNHNNWHFKHYNQLWSERLPNSEQVTINGEIYVHWYDCLTDYIF